jgi:hypothetical protein
MAVQVKGLYICAKYGTESFVGRFMLVGRLVSIAVLSCRMLC